MGNQPITMVQLSSGAWVISPEVSLTAPVMYAANVQGAVEWIAKQERRLARRSAAQVAAYCLAIVGVVSVLF